VKPVADSVSCNNRPGRRAFLRSLSCAAAAVAVRPPVLRASGAPVSIVAGGDAIITRPLRSVADPGVTELLALIRSADVGFANCEMTFHRYEGYPGPTGACGDLNLVADPALTAELRWGGFNLVTLANNHALDYGHDGLLATIRYLREARIQMAGAGANLSLARQPAYLDTAHGRVALVACASTFRPGSEASRGHDEIAGRPGVSPLRVTAGAAEAHASDVAAITAQITRARAEADVVLVTIHAHERGNTREIPAPFLQPFARACVDAGAHAFLGHGPHVIRALEIYKEAPIFYSLGNLFFQAETIQQIPQEIYDTCELSSHSPSDFFAKVMGRMFEADVYWEAVVPRMQFRNGRLELLTLYPVDLSRHLPPTRRGTPAIAKGPVALLVLQRQQALSLPFGTRIDIDSGVGTVRLG